MHMSEKLQAQKPTVVYGPHRLRMSSVATRPIVFATSVMPSEDIGETKIAGGEIDIPTVVIAFDELK